MTDLSLWLEASGALAGAGGLGYAKVRAPRVYWSLVGLLTAWGRFTLSYRSTMDVCGLTVHPSGLRAFMVRNVARREVQPVPPKVRRVRGTSTGLRVTLRLPARPGADGRRRLLGTAAPRLGRALGERDRD